MGYTYYQLPPINIKTRLDWNMTKTITLIPANLASIFILPIILLCTACEFSKDLNVKNIEGYEFSLHDIQEHCTVKRDGDKNLAIVCAKKKLNSLVHGCEGQVTKGLSDPRFSCGGGLWVLNKICYIEMLNTHSGNIKCKTG